jgi:hypothetical protein
MIRRKRDHYAESSMTVNKAKPIKCIARENNIRPSQSNVPDADIGQSSTSRPQVCQPQLPGIHARLGLDFATLLPDRKVSIFMSSFDTS